MMMPEAKKLYRKTYNLFNTYMISSVGDTSRLLQEGNRTHDKEFSAYARARLFVQGRLTEEDPCRYETRFANPGSSSNSHLFLTRVRIDGFYGYSLFTIR
ncbi:hypothetical protein PoB_005486000 [Plakobranchus ocellatus]|uniref:Uncharacterized protein n=1 Tax=Plakobranchus ocellatus TaxID=259542 RepID=A0AAV4C9I7_9GAST|nr:hypothetical protein PoB_005486000 [Plakobranchus ocellatus]